MRCPVLCLSMITALSLAATSRSAAAANADDALAITCSLRNTFYTIVYKDALSSGTVRWQSNRGDIQNEGTADEATIDFSADGGETIRVDLETRPYSEAKNDRFTVTLHADPQTDAHGTFYRGGGSFVGWRAGYDAVSFDQCVAWGRELERR